MRWARGRSAPGGRSRRSRDPGRGVRPWLGLAAAALACGAFPCSGGVAAQTAESVGREADPTPAWLARWRPLESLADLTRTLPGARHELPDLLTRAAPREGLSWSAGNPAALAFEMDDTRADLGLSYDRDHGDYRRPLDPGSEANWRLEGMGWRPIGARSGVIGRVEVRRTSVTDTAFADVLAPYGSSPFVVLDTLGDGLNRTVARIEGAGGWAVGDFAFGLGLGYESQDTRTKRSNVPRTNRTAMPAATAGIAWRPGGRRFTIGFHARWQQNTEDIAVFSIGAGSRLYAPGGYTEPVALDVSSSSFTRRFERTAYAVGVGAAGQLGDAIWVVYGQRENRSEDRFTAFSIGEPLTDTWDANGWTVGAAARLPFGALSVGVDGRFTALDGDGVRGDIGLPSFTAEERRLALSGDVRLDHGGPWLAELRTAVVRETRLRTDLIERVASDISAWSPRLSAEVARRLSRRIAFSIGGSFVSYTPAASTPDAATIGSAYQKWIAPELGLMATGATAWSGGTTLAIDATGRTRLWLRGQWVSARPDSPSEPQSDTPVGTRTHGVLTLGITLSGS